MCNLCFSGLCLTRGVTRCQEWRRSGHIISTEEDSQYSNPSSQQYSLPAKHHRLSPQSALREIQTFNTLLQITILFHLNCSQQETRKCRILDPASFRLSLSLRSEYFTDHCIFPTIDEHDCSANICTLSWIYVLADTARILSVAAVTFDNARQTLRLYKWNMTETAYWTPLKYNSLNANGWPLCQVINV